MQQPANSITAFNAKDRLIYTFDDDRIDIIVIGGHYE
jgi:Txe/YoeB family toxin of Txe-Axe toxin-antitoxin module